MGKRVHYVRAVSETEEQQLRTLANSRIQPHRLVQRAQLIINMLDDSQLTSLQSCHSRLDSKQGVSGAHIGFKRFNEAGIEGLADNPRSGKPITHSIEVRSQLIDLALHKPKSLGYPCELWTLERLHTVFNQREGVYLSLSTIWNWLTDEGLSWKRQQSWFDEAEKQDDQFVEKRGL